MDWLKTIIAALESGMEVNISIRKSRPEPSVKKPGNPAPNSVTCPECGWKHSYSRHDNAVRGLRAHSKACKGKVKREGITPPQWLEEQTKGEKRNGQ